MAFKDRAEFADEKSGSSRARARPMADIDRLLPLYHIGGLAYFGYRMVLAARMFDRRILQILKQHGGLSLPQWRVLSQLGLIPTATVRSLADGAAVDRAEVSRVLQELGERGLVERRDNSADLRSPIFSLTSGGREVFETARKPISSFITHLVDSVPAEDLEAADRVLWAVTRGTAGSGPGAP